MGEQMTAYKKQQDGAVRHFHKLSNYLSRELLTLSAEVKRNARTGDGALGAELGMALEVDKTVIIEEPRLASKAFPAPSESVVSALRKQLQVSALERPVEEIGDKSMPG